MELTGIGGKNSLTTLVEWSGLMAAAPKKEAVPSVDKNTSAPLKMIDMSEIVTQHQEAVKALSERIMAFLDATRFSLEFIPNRDSGQVTIRVLNSAGKVIRQIPPEEIDRFSDQSVPLTGLLVDEKLK
jgi:uncharacterized FlaG/YvyC family protein